MNMRHIVVQLVKCWGFGLLFTSMLAAAQTARDRAYWQEIAKNHYAVPGNESADVLAHELSSLLGSPDPELRDDLAYSILARWIYRGVLPQPTLIALTDEWRANLKSGLGEKGTNSVLKRSFSALGLAAMTKREGVSPFMGAERYHRLVAEGIAYLQAERDLRGYDATLHWIHATAHTGDLLAALALNSQLTQQEAADILTAISDRLASAADVFTQGEQDRVAAVVLAIIHRPDFATAKFDSWLSELQNEDREVWTNTTPESLARYQNHTYLLQALFTRLAFEPDLARIGDFRQQILAVIKGRLD
jgi:hypothetical protein